MTEGRSARIFDRIMEVGREISIAMILFLMLGISARVIIRYTLGTPINWVVDLATIFQVYITFLAAAWLLREEGHISLDIVLSFLKPRQQFFLQIVNSVLCGLMCAIITMYGVKETWSSWQLSLHLNMPMEPPTWSLLMVIPLGSFLLCIQFARRTHGYLSRYRTALREVNTKGF